MHLYKYWARQSKELATTQGPRLLSAVGWSDDNEDVARQMAEQKLLQLCQRFVDGPVQRREAYPYVDGRPLQEELLRDVRDDDGSRLAVLTRNAYGAEVLNTERALFIDLDFASLPDSRGFWRKLIGGKASPTDLALAHVDKMAARYRGWSFRVYRTFAGLRVVLLSRPALLADPMELEMLRTFGSDPMYVKLCESQRSFRARLTPKPWRCKLPRPPARFPFANERARAMHQAWLRRYAEISARHSSCELLTEVGDGPTAPVVAKILALHDSVAVKAGLPLA
jgi:hypothetical protein